PRGAGPYGWKEVARYQLPQPYRSSTRIISDPNLGNAAIDSFMIVGPTFDRNGVIDDTSAIRVIRHGQGVLFHPLANTFRLSNRYVPAIAGINPIEPWGAFYKGLADADFDKADYDGFRAIYDASNPQRLFDSALVGTIKLDRARIPYNPLFFDNFTFEVSKTYKERVLDSIAIDGIAVRYETTRVKNPNGNDSITVETSVVDSVYFTRSGRLLKSGGVDKYIVDGALPIDNFALAMNDSVRVKRALDSLYSYIQTGKVVYEFPDFESDSLVKSNVIVPYMTEITGNRTFTDIGDDNRDGVFSNTADFDNTEKLINNTPYFYRVLAYDKGDASQPTPVKINTSVPNVNQIEAFPEAAEVGAKLEFEIIEMDSSKFNGLYDFEFFAIDEDRAKQLFLGDTLELNFEVLWNHFTANLQVRDDNPDDVGVTTNNYLRRATLTNLSEDSTLLYNQAIQFNPNGCFTSEEVASALYENAAVVAGSTNPILRDGDTITTFGVWNNSEIIDYSGRFTSGDFTAQNHCNSRFFLPPAYGTLGFNFKFGLLQHGGRYRADKTEILEGDAETLVYALETEGPLATIGTLRSQAVDTIQAGLSVVSQNNQSAAIPFIAPVYGSFNNGPVDALVEFVGSGTETMELEWGRGNNAEVTSFTEKSTFTINYLDVKVTNNYSFTTSNVKNQITVGNSKDMEHISINPVTTGDITTSAINDAGSPIVVIRKAYPDPRNLPAMDIEVEEFFGKYNLAAFGHVNIDKNNGFSTRRHSVARPTNDEALRSTLESYTGLPQGRYYLNGTDSQGN
ncbi:MAG: hypothetical protein RIF34_04530, partial [Candidatus Kapaibacterium sp.]